MEENRETTSNIGQLRPKRKRRRCLITYCHCTKYWFDRCNSRLFSSNIFIEKSFWENLRILAESFWKIKRPKMNSYVTNVLPLKVWILLILIVWEICIYLVITCPHTRARQDFECKRLNNMNKKKCCTYKVVLFALTITVK